GLPPRAHPRRACLASINAANSSLAGTPGASGRCSGHPARSSPSPPAPKVKCPTGPTQPPHRTNGTRALASCLSLRISTSCHPYFRLCFGSLGPYLRNLEQSTEIPRGDQSAVALFNPAGGEVFSFPRTDGFT